MKLEAVIVCVNYSDFLAHTLPTNKQIFDRVVVVTDKKDEGTKRICDFNYVQCIQTDVFYENGNKFNKAKGICEGLKVLGKEDWVIQMDADIYLPPLTKTILHNIQNHLPKDSLFTVDRMMCPSYEAWQKFISDPRLLHTGWVYIHPDAFRVGVRIGSYMHDGYQPIGYFQMWNPKGSNVFDYPIIEAGADRTDVLHAKRFPREKRVLIPEIVAIHLDSEGLGTNKMGANWFGRKTKKFGPEEQLEDVKEKIEESIVEEEKTRIIPKVLPEDRTRFDDELIKEVKEEIKKHPHHGYHHHPPGRRKKIILALISFIMFLLYILFMFLKK